MILLFCSETQDKKEICSLEFSLLLDIIKVLARIQEMKHQELFKLYTEQDEQIKALRQSAPEMVTTGGPPPA